VSGRLARVALAAALVAAAGPAAARPRGADGRFERRDSPHFTLLQDVDIDRTSGLRGAARFEREVLSALETAHDALDRLLGLRPERRIEVRVYDPRLFDARYAGVFPFGVAGFAAGALHVRGEAALTAALSRTLAHELVHAALDQAAPSLVLPAWLNEGLAEWFEHRLHGGRRLSAAQWAALREAARSGAWIPLAVLSGPSFAGLDGQSAPFAYLQAHALVDHLARRGGERDLAGFLADLLQRRDLARALARGYGLDAAGLEAALLAELRGAAAAPRRAT
jgi:hypothetical protein